MHNGAQVPRASGPDKAICPVEGGNIVCPVCEGEEFVHEEAVILGGGSERGYGTRRLQRAQLVCENCTYVMSFDLSKLLAAQGSDGPDY